MSFMAELRQALYDLPLAQQPGRDEVAHFCSHSGIRRVFTRARTTWQAMAPSAIRPWWMILDPLKRKTRNTDDKNENPNNKKFVNEVLDNA